MLFDSRCLKIKHLDAHKLPPNSPNGMSDADGASIHIDFGGVKVTHLDVSEHHHTERLIYLKQAHIFLLHTRLLEQFGHGVGGRDGEVDRGAGRIRKCCK